jgi:hypothetical protein
MPKYLLKGGITSAGSALRLASVMEHLEGLGLVFEKADYCSALTAEKVTSGGDIEISIEKELPKDQLEHLGLEEVV